MVGGRLGKDYVIGASERGHAGARTVARQPRGVNKRYLMLHRPFYPALTLTTYLTYSLHIRSRNSLCQTASYTFESILHSIDYNHCIILIIVLQQQKAQQNQRYDISRAPHASSMALTLTPYSTRACSHGQPSCLDPGQEPLISLLHPRRRGPDAIDALSAYTPQSDTRCAGA